MGLFRSPTSDIRVPLRLHVVHGKRSGRLWRPRYGAPQGSRCRSSASGGRRRTRCTAHSALFYALGSLRMSYTRPTGGVLHGTRSLGRYCTFLPNTRRSPRSNGHTPRKGERRDSFRFQGGIRLKKCAEPSPEGGSSNFKQKTTTDT